jgi:hypothetical protein
MQMIGLSSSTLTMFGLFWERREELRIKSGQQGAASKRFAGEFMITGRGPPAPDCGAAPRDSRVAEGPGRRRRIRSGKWLKKHGRRGKSGKYSRAF